MAVDTEIPTEHLEMDLHPDQTDDLLATLAEHDPVMAAEVILSFGESARDEHLQLATQLIGEFPSEKGEYVQVSLNMSDLRPGPGLRWQGQREEFVSRLVAEWRRRDNDEWATLAGQIGERLKDEASSNRRRWLWAELMQLGYQRGVSTRSAEKLTREVVKKS